MTRDEWAVTVAGVALLVLGFLLGRTAGLQECADFVEGALAETERLVG